MNNLKQQYLDWKLENQDKYSTLTDFSKSYQISLLEVISEYKDSNKYTIPLNLNKFHPKFISLLTTEQLLKANYLVFKSIYDFNKIISHTPLLELKEQLYLLYKTFKKHKLNKLYIYDILIDNISKNPIAIIVLKINDNGNIYYQFQTISFVYLLFLTSIYKDILTVSE